MKKVIFAFAICLCSTTSFAGTGDEERQLLIKSASEIEYVLSLIEKAEEKDNKKGNVSLDYSALRSDLQLIQDAITRHASRPNRTPRSINSLSKSYVK